MTDPRPSVLIADDNREVVDAICRLLEREYRIAEKVSDGSAAIRYAQEFEPDFAILDISMPEVDGIKVARCIRKANLVTRVVFVTFLDDEDYAEAARSIGHGYVLKHRLSLDLIAAIRAAGEGNFFSSRDVVLPEKVS